MHRLVRGFAAVIALAWGVAPAWAAGPEASTSQAASAPWQLAQNLPASNNDPYSNPIRRANPNSMQGTQPANPPPRGVVNEPRGRPPTLENGGIGNGYPQGAPPANPDPRLPSPSYDANGNRR